jgi:hypothetical protein
MIVSFRLQLTRIISFCQSELVREIERIKDRDPDYWRVYGEGQRAVFSDRQIFQKWEYIPFKEFPELDWHLGCDFGFSNDSTCNRDGGKKE